MGAWHRGSGDTGRALLVALILLALGVVGLPLVFAGAASADGAGGDTIIVQQDTCGHTERGLWMFEIDLGWATITALGAPGFSVGPIWAGYNYHQAMSCYKTPQITIPTLESVMGDIAAISGEVVDAALADDLGAYTSGLSDLLEDNATMMTAWEDGDLNSWDRSTLSGVFESIALAASSTRDKVLQNSWMTYGLVLPLSSMEIAAYSAAAETSTPGGVRQAKERGFAEDAYAETLDALRTKENQVRGLLHDLTIYRYFRTWRKHPNLPNSAAWEVHTKVQRGSVEYGGQPKDKSCTQWHSCTDFKSQRESYFTAAESAYRAERKKLMSAVTPGYLAAKAAFGYNATFGGEADDAFYLVNNRQSSDKKDMCVGVEGDAAAKSGSRLMVRQCAYNVSSAAGRSQVWDYVPGTPFLRNLNTGLCLQGTTKPASAGGAYDVPLTTCPEVTADTTAGQLVVELPANPQDDDGQTHFDARAWGIHPAGYLVGLESGRCLDPAVSLSPGSLIQAAPCEYGLASGRKTLDAPPSGSIYDGVRFDDSTFSTDSNIGGSLDPVTDQVWHVKAAPSVPVRVALSGDSGVRVTSSPAGIDCGGGGSTCQADFGVGAQVRLTAAPSSSSSDGSAVSALWSGACAGSDASCAFTVGIPAQSGSDAGKVAVAADVTLTDPTPDPAPDPTPDPAPDPTADPDPGTTDPGTTDSGAGADPVTGSDPGGSLVPEPVVGPVVHPVVKVSPVVRVRAVRRVRAGARTPVVVSVAAHGVRVSGKVRVRVRLVGPGRRRVRGRVRLVGHGPGHGPVWLLHGGRVRVRVFVPGGVGPRVRLRVTASYLGSPTLTGVKKAKTVRVLRSTR